VRGRAALWIDIAVKVLFMGLLALGAFSGLEQRHEREHGRGRDRSPCGR